MDTKGLKEIIDSGKIITVRFNNDEIEDYTFLNKGMIAKLYKIEEMDESFKCYFDISEFDNHNLPLQSSNYYDKNNNPTLTAFEKGLWKDKETFYIDENFEAFFSIIEENTLFDDYIKSNENIGYVKWLENIIINRLK